MIKKAHNKARMKVSFYRHICDDGIHCVIYSRVSLDGERKDLGTTNIKIETRHWDLKSKRVLPGNSQYSFYNEIISRLETKVTAIYNDFKRTDDPFNAQMIVDSFHNGLKPISLIDAFDLFINYKKDVHKRARNTISSYSNVKVLLEKFLKIKKLDKIPFSAFDTVKLDSYIDWMILSDQYEYLTRRKHIIIIKSMANWVVEKKHWPKNAIERYPVPPDIDIPIINLNESEFETLKNYRFSNKYLQEVADVFIVYCRTGFHYEDLKELKTNYKDLILTGLDGKDWIYKARLKTEIKAKVPILSEVNDVISKYGGWEKLPIKSNTKMNQHLKVIAATLGFNSGLCVTSGRKTLTDWLLNVKNFSRE